MIEIKNVSAGYGKENIIKNLNLTINDNEKISIIGPNGCGKTTFLRVLSGILPFTGEVLIDGISINKYKSKALAKKISMLSQINDGYFSYSVLDTVLMGRFPYQNGFFNVNSDKDKAIAIDALKTVGLANLESKSINSLSGGQVQRVFLAKIICQNPDIILLDEPTNHLDLSFGAQFGDFLIDWAKSQNKCIIGVLHDLNLAMKISDKMILMDNGENIIADTPKNVLSSPKLEKVYNINVKDYMIENLRQWENI